MPRKKTPKKKKAKTTPLERKNDDDEVPSSKIISEEESIPSATSSTTNQPTTSTSKSDDQQLSDDSDNDINSSSSNNNIINRQQQERSSDSTTLTPTMDSITNNIKPHQATTNDQEEILDFPVKKLNGRKSNNNVPFETEEGRDEKTNKLAPEQNSSEPANSDPMMDLSGDDTQPSRKSSKKTSNTPKKSITRSSTPVASNNKRKRQSSAQSSSDEEADDDNRITNRELSDDGDDDEDPETTANAEAVPKTPTRSQQRSRKGGNNTPSVASTPQTPSSSTLSRPRKLDVSKKLLVLRPEDLISLNKLRTKISQAVKESKSMPVNKSSPKKQDSDISRLSVTVNSLSEADLQLLADEKQRTGTVTLIDSTHTSRKYRDFNELEELEDKGADLTNVPVPNFTVAKDTTARKGFRRTHHYMKYTNTENYDHETLMLNPTPNLHAEFDTYCHRKIDISLEYNMESDDEKWLNEYNTGRRNPLSKKDFECIIALMNRACKNGKISWFSTASIIDLSRFFNVKLQEHDIVAVKKLWESRYNNVDRKKKEHETRIENEIRLVNLYDLKEKFLKLKAAIKSEQDYASKQKDLVEKQMKQMNKNDFDVSSSIPKFAQKFNTLRKKDQHDLKLEAIQQLKEQEEEIYKEVKYLDEPEIEMYNRENEEDLSPSLIASQKPNNKPQPSTTNGPLQHEPESTTNSSENNLQGTTGDQQSTSVTTRRRTRKRKDTSTPGSNSEETNTPESPQSPSLVPVKPYTFSRLSSRKKKQTGSSSSDNSPSSPSSSKHQ